MDTRVAPRDTREGSPEKSSVRTAALLVHFLTALAVCATLTGRSLSAALPGTVAGIASVIRVVSLLSDLLSQLFAFAGIGTILFFSRTLLFSRETGRIFKALMLPATLLVGFVVLLRMRLDHADPNGSLALALTSGALALAATPRLLGQERTRAMGLILLLSGSGALVHAISALLAFQASLQGLSTRFLVARGVETVTFALELGVMIMATLWLHSRGRGAPLRFAALLALVGVFTWGVLRGSLPDASWWQVLASRSVNQLITSPRPFVPDLVVGAVLTTSLGLAIWFALTQRKPIRTAAVVCFCLLSGGATDVPLLALALTLAALLARVPLALDDADPYPPPPATEGGDSGPT